MQEPSYLAVAGGCWLWHAPASSNPRDSKGGLHHDGDARGSSHVTAHRVAPSTSVQTLSQYSTSQHPTPVPRIAYHTRTRFPSLPGPVPIPGTDKVRFVYPLLSPVVGKRTGP
eukprot:3641977-Rhodomonas_salina.1